MAPHRSFFPVGGKRQEWCFAVEAMDNRRGKDRAMRRCPMLLLFLLLGWACASGTGTPSPGKNDSAVGIRPCPQNPRYWQYKGKPVMLIGGSREDNLFQIPDLEEHLDSLAGVGGNYIRNTMSSRDSANVWPFHRRADGKYDLDRLSDEYFRRFENLLRLTSSRDIIVQLELWDRFDFAREPWLENSYRPANNVNYTSEKSGLANEYPRHPGQNDNPFFRSVPENGNNELLLKYQRAQVDRMLEISLRYPNVLYTMDNETNGTPEWGAYWSDYIRRKAAEAGVDIFTTEMWDAWDLTSEEHRRTLDHPERYAFADISQNNHNTGQKHWDNLQWVRMYTAEKLRPLNQVKIYGADTGRYGTDRDGIERFWRGIIGGGASVRFHRPTSGLGLGESARACIRSARMFLAEFDIFSAVPDAESRLLSGRSDDEAYLTAVPGERYALYFPEGGSVRLDLRDAGGDFSVKWLDIRSSRWHDAPKVRGGGFAALDAPGNGHWAVVIR